MMDFMYARHARISLAGGPGLPGGGEPVPTPPQDRPPPPDLFPPPPSRAPDEEPDVPEVDEPQDSPQPHPKLTGRQEPQRQLVR